MEMRESLKKVVHALMKSKKTYSELLELGIPEKTLSRVLKDILEFIGLAKKENGYWTWYTYLTEYNASELPFIVKHSKQLLPGLEALLAYRPQGRYQITTSDYVSPEEIDQLKKYADSHLKTAIAYQPIYANLVKFKNLKSKLEKISTEGIDKMLRGLSGKIVTPDPFMLRTRKKEPSQSWLRKLFPEWNVRTFKEDIPYLLGPFKTEEEILDLLGVSEVNHNGVFQTNKRKEWFVIGPVNLVLNSQKDLKTLDEFIQTKNLMMNVYQEFAGQIMTLIMRVEADQPLQGKCGGCPSFKISEHEGSQVGL